MIWTTEVRLPAAVTVLYLLSTVFRRHLFPNQPPIHRLAELFLLKLNSRDVTLTPHLPSTPEAKNVCTIFHISIRLHGVMIN